MENALKLVVQIPCYNEEHTLGITVADIPRTIEGVDQVELLIIDDGSEDDTVEVARALEVDHLVRLPRHCGLARAFMAGLDAALALGADIIVNTDADNQYRGEDIVSLIEPILRGEAEMVIGDRKPETIAHFSLSKRYLQRFGSWVVRFFSKTDVHDTTSGFRAFSREAALKMNVLSEYSYTLESIIQAGNKQIAISSTPVKVNQPLRQSMLITSVPDYLKRSALAILRSYAMYEPLKIFILLGALFFASGLALGSRFLYYYLFGEGATGHVQSVVLAGVLLILGFMIWVLGILADLIAANRTLMEETLYRVKKMELSSNREGEAEMGQSEGKEGGRTGRY